MRRKIARFLLVGALFVLINTTAWALSSTNYTMGRISTDTNLSTGSSANYIAQLSVGDANAVGSATSANYTILVGYEGAKSDEIIVPVYYGYLPLLAKP